MSLRTILCFMLSIGVAQQIVAADKKLDFNFFKNEVQPIFLAKRSGNMRCIDCHAGKAYSRFNIMPLSPERYFWTEEESRSNFEAASAFVIPGSDPLKSRLLTHPLAAISGGDPFHGGGKHFHSTNDPEWQILRQ